MSGRFRISEHTMHVFEIAGTRHRLWVVQFSRQVFCKQTQNRRALSCRVFPRDRDRSKDEKLPDS